MTEGTLADDPREVRISTDGARANVTVDGIDLSGSLAAYTLEHRANQVPLLVLYPRPPVDGVVFDGMTHVAVASEAPPAEAIAAFLTGVDPAALQKAALDRHDLDGTPTELTTAMLRQLMEWATGGTP
ncbi:hypothetical protein [Streptomyces sp. H27-C3]|uniref:hypothetical protein n=1 Tax=Streptomyces sp. H27-C3 TaxID=3046305 RepID=UPI0024BB6D88|nr:hypothetical protein [Streptomyces sp. H27-C3]MDJ0464987.1 hypothetical protein [Streptomyces sp. H27-C3]